MFSKYFIERPILASVVAIVITLGGFLGLRGLGVEQYPSVTPPQVVVSARYPGADAETIAKTVASPIEEAINGVENMIYMQSTSSADGTTSVNVYFETGSDSLKAQIDVNNRVQAIVSTLPTEAQRYGVSVTSRSTSMLGFVTFFSPNGSMNVTDVNNYLNINVLDEMKRVNGIGSAIVFGSRDYSMRIEIKPDLLAKYNLTPADIATSVNEQNSQQTAGSLGQAPMRKTAPFVYKLKPEGRLKTVEEFKSIIIRSDGTNVIHLGDVASVSIGALSYTATGIYGKNSKVKPMVGMGLFMQNGANAVATMDNVREKLEELKKDFGGKLDYSVVYDTTKFVDVSIDEVIKTFIEAILLVLVVMYFFLKNIRATIIPMITIPVAILGTFGILYLIGFTINLITLFALLLSIGLVVDDAIVVIENVERILQTTDVSPKQAAIQSMEEVARPVISIVLVLSAVFIPVAFLSGFSGEIQRQFALTLVSSIVISGFIALTLTPALCGAFLKKKESEPFWIVKKFNDYFDWSTKVFMGGVSTVLRHVIASLIVVGILFFMAYKFFQVVPTSLLPDEDQGVIIVMNTLPPGYTLAQTDVNTHGIAQAVLQNPNIKEMGGVIGLSLATFTAQEDSSIMFFGLKDWSKRLDQNQSSFAIANMYNKMFWLNPQSQTFFINPPAIMGMGISGGFEVYLESKLGKSYEEIAQDVQKVLAVARKRPELNVMRLQSSLVTNTPQYNIIVNKDKLKMLNINTSTLFSTLSATVGQYYINDFNLFGKTYQVSIRAGAGYREAAKDLDSIFVRSTTGEMVPITSVVSLKRYTGPVTVDRFNLYAATKLSGIPNVGYTSGQALNALEESIREVLSESDYGIGYSGSTFQEVQSQKAGNTAFLYGLVFVFLILAAQYERWLMPAAIIASVPFAALGALVSTYYRGYSNDLYFQIGLLVLIGLSAKNAILIVEFAMEARQRGKSLFDSALEASKLRFRPVIMTSIAFILGVSPMVFATGAGAASRHSLGTGVVGGMIVASSIALFFIPLFFYLVEGLSEWLTKKRGGEVTFSHEATKEG